MLARNTKLRLLLRIGDAIIVHFERANHAANIMGVDDRSGLGVALGKQGMQSLLANTLGKLLIARTAIVLKFTRGKVHLIEGGLEIQPRTPAKHRQAALAKQALNMRASVSLIKRSRICHTRLYNVDETQRRRTLIGRHLCGTDVHAAIDLHRIARQHFGRKTSGQTVGNITLTNRRRTDDRNGGKTCPGRNH